MTTTGTWYPPAALQPSTYDPSAGTGGFLASPPFRPMADLTVRSLHARRIVGDQVLLDWLEVTRLAIPWRHGAAVRVAMLRQAWGVTQSQVSRRIARINSAPPEAGLGRITRALGSQGWWLVLPASVPCPLQSRP